MYVLYACAFFTVGIIDFQPVSIAEIATWGLDLWISVVMFGLSLLALAAACIDGPHLTR